MWEASYAAGEHSAEHMTVLITFHRSSLLEIRSELNPIIQEALPNKRRAWCMSRDL
jgi:hypothetical protein